MKFKIKKLFILSISLVITFFIYSNFDSYFNDDFKQVNEKFFYKDNPIHPLIIKKFCSWISDDWRPKVISIDIAAAYNSNEFYKNFDLNKKNDRTFSCTLQENEEIFTYQWLGKLENEIHVIKVLEDPKDGSAIFSTLFFFKIHEEKAYTPDGKKYFQLLITFVRNYPLEDRDDSQIDLLKNKVLIGKSKYRTKPIFIEFHNN